jgi:hypothetical protein
MSLTDWVDWDRELIDLLFTKPPFGLKREIKAQPQTKNYHVVGMAFDYVFRLYMQKINSKLVSEFPLVAERGVHGDKKRRNFIKDFKDKKDEYLNDRLALYELISDCLILANIEIVFRSGRDFPNSELFVFSNQDIIDIINLLKLTENYNWKGQRQCYLNPSFGKSSIDLGGADTDLIIDDKLIDIKTTKEFKFRPAYFRQLIGYYILNIREKNMYGIIKTLGIYYSRHGFLFEFSVPEMNPIKFQNKPIDALKAVEISIKKYREALPT